MRTTIINRINTKTVKKKCVHRAWCTQNMQKTIDTWD